MFVPHRVFDAAINMRAFSSNQLANELIQLLTIFIDYREKEHNKTIIQKDKMYFSFTRLKAAIIDFFWAKRTNCAHNIDILPCKFIIANGLTNNFVNI